MTVREAIAILQQCDPDKQLDASIVLSKQPLYRLSSHTSCSVTKYRSRELKQGDVTMTRCFSMWNTRQPRQGE